jgi:cell division transport system permease protein
VEGAMLFKKPSVLVTDERSNRPIRLIIGCLVFVLTLILSGTLALNHFVEKFSTNSQDNLVFEVNLEGVDPTQHISLLGTLQQAINAFPPVKESFVIPLEQPSLPASMKDASLKSPPMLTFIEAHTYPNAPYQASELLMTLRHIHGGTHIQSNHFIQKNLRYLHHSLTLFSYGIIALLYFAIIVTISLITRSTLKMHGNVIDILRLVGATNNYIAKQFQWVAFRLGFSSSLLGVSLGVIIFFMVTSFATRFGLPSDFIVFNQNILVSFILLPLFVGFISLFVARFEVIRTLIRLDV